MAKSSTKRKQRIKPDPTQVEQVKQGVVNAVQYITHWQRQELISLSMNQKPGSLPVCIPVGKEAYVVGNYGLRRIGKVWQVTSTRTENKLHFSKRSTALIYLLCSQTKYPKLAAEILQQESTIIKLLEELDHFNYSLDKSKRKRDWWRVDHFTNLASNVEFKLLEARNQLEKSVDLAKYFKIWDNKI